MKGRDLAIHDFQIRLRFLKEIMPGKILANLHLVADQSCDRQSCLVGQQVDATKIVVPFVMIDVRNKAAQQFCGNILLY